MPLLSPPTSLFCANSPAIHGYFILQLTSRVQALVTSSFSPLILIGIPYTGPARVDSDRFSGDTVSANHTSIPTSSRLATTTRSILRFAFRTLSRLHASPPTRSYRQAGFHSDTVSRPVLSSGSDAAARRRAREDGGRSANTASPSFDDRRARAHIEAQLNLHTGLGSPSHPSNHPTRTPQHILHCPGEPGDELAANQVSPSPKLDALRWGVGGRWLSTPPAASRNCPECAGTCAGEGHWSGRLHCACRPPAFAFPLRFFRRTVTDPGRPVAIAPAMYPPGTSPASTYPGPGGNLVSKTVLCRTHICIPMTLPSASRVYSQVGQRMRKPSLPIGCAAQQKENFGGAVTLI